MLLYLISVHDRPTASHEGRRHIKSFVMTGCESSSGWLRGRTQNRRTHRKSHHHINHRTDVTWFAVLLFMRKSAGAIKSQSNKQEQMKRWGNLSKWTFSHMGCLINSFIHSWSRPPTNLDLWTYIEFTVWDRFIYSKQKPQIILYLTNLVVFNKGVWCSYFTNVLNFISVNQS